MDVYAAISVIVEATVIVAGLATFVALVTGGSTARGSLSSFVRRLVDVFVSVAARSLNTAIGAAQARGIAGGVDRISGRTAATSGKSQQTTAGEHQLAHVTGFHALSPSEMDQPTRVSMCSSPGSCWRLNRRTVACAS
jgi:hypothetical protein